MFIVSRQGVIGTPCSFTQHQNDDVSPSSFFLHTMNQQNRDKIVEMSSKERETCFPCCLVDISELLRDTNYENVKPY
jgi:hypothetical protein